MSDKYPHGKKVKEKIKKRKPKNINLSDIVEEIHKDKVKKAIEDKTTTLRKISPKDYVSMSEVDKRKFRLATLDLKTLQDQGNHLQSLATSTFERLSFDPAMELHNLIMDCRLKLDGLWNEDLDDWIVEPEQSAAMRSALVNAQVNLMNTAMQYTYSKPTQNVDITIKDPLSIVLDSVGNTIEHNVIEDIAIEDVIAKLEEKENVSN